MYFDLLISIVYRPLLGCSAIPKGAWYVTEDPRNCDATPDLKPLPCSALFPPLSLLGGLFPTLLSSSSPSAALRSLLNSTAPRQVQKTFGPQSDAPLAFCIRSLTRLFADPLLRTLVYSSCATSRRFMPLASEVAREMVKSSTTSISTSPANSA